MQSKSGSVKHTCVAHLPGCRILISDPSDHGGELGVMNSGPRLGSRLDMEPT